MTYLSEWTMDVTIDDVSNQIIVHDNEISLKINGGAFDDIVYNISKVDCRELAILETGKKRGKAYEAMFRRFDALKDKLKSHVLDYIDSMRCVAADCGICEDE